MIHHQICPARSNVRHPCWCPTLNEAGNMAVEQFRWNAMKSLKTLMEVDHDMSRFGYRDGLQDAYVVVQQLGVRDPMIDAE